MPASMLQIALPQPVPRSLPPRVVAPADAIGFANTPIDYTKLAPIDVSGYQYLWVGGSCSVSNAQMNFTLVSFDDAGAVLGVSRGYGLAASGVAYRTPAGAYPAQGTEMCLDVSGAATVALVPTAVAGTWTLLQRLF